MPMTRTEIALLRRAMEAALRNLHEGNWCQHFNAEGEFTRPVSPIGELACKWCFAGRIEYEAVKLGVDPDGLLALWSGSFPALGLHSAELVKANDGKDGFRKAQAFVRSAVQIAREYENALPAEGA